MPGFKSKQCQIYESRAEKLHACKLHACKLHARKLYDRMAEKTRWVTYDIKL